MGSVRTVVFVCQHGAAKSVLAAALLERLAAERGVPLRALPRGTEPEPQVAPAVASGLLAKGVDVAAWQPGPLTPGDLVQAWRVVSFRPDLLHLVPNARPSRSGMTSPPWPTPSGQHKRRSPAAALLR